MKILWDIVYINFKDIYLFNSNKFKLKIKKKVL